MKKTLFVAAILGAMVASADDSYLYWMVGSSDVSYDYARVRTMDGAYLSIYDTAFDEPYTYNDEVGGMSGIKKEWVEDVRSNGEGLYAALGSNPLGSDFVIELYNYENTFVGQSVVSYNPESIYTGGLSIPGNLAMAAPVAFAIPEPSSGLLMLVGCAMLGLRRRKVKTA